MTVQEIAEYLKVHRDTIYAMCRRKEIPHVRVGQRILFRQSTIEAWMAQQETENYIGFKS